MHGRYLGIQYHNDHFTGCRQYNIFLEHWRNLWTHWIYWDPFISETNSVVSLQICKLSFEHIYQPIIACLKLMSLLTIRVCTEKWWIPLVEPIHGFIFQKKSTLLAFCEGGLVLEIDSPDGAKFDTSKTFHITGLPVRSFKFKSIKSRLRVSVHSIDISIY